MFAMSSSYKPAPVKQQTHYTPPPPPSLNGGLYTGEPFWPGAPWRNFPATPDSSYLVHVNLRSANPPTQALYQYPAAGQRPGNNYSPMPGIRPLGDQFSDILCAPDVEDTTSKDPRFRKYAYIHDTK